MTTEDFYKTLLDNLFDGVYFVDPGRRITYWNHAAEDITGYRADDVVGRCCHDNILQHVDADGRPLCHSACPVAATIEDGALREAEVTLHHKNGHRVPVHVRVSPIRNGSGAITGAVEIFSDNTARLRERERVADLERQSLMDAMTFVANRRCLEMNIASRLQELGRYGHTFGVLFMDVDRFKSVNDTYGHDVGDEVLKMVARTLSANTRVFDIIGRWGGEEFVAILMSMDKDSLDAVAEKFRSLISRSSLDQGFSSIAVTVSIGATLARDGDTVAGLVKRADELMYRSKKNGRNQVTVG